MELSGARSASSHETPSMPPKSQPQHRIALVFVKRTKNKAKFCVVHPVCFLFLFMASRFFVAPPIRSGFYFSIYDVMGLPGSNLNSAPGSRTSLSARELHRCDIPKRTQRKQRDVMGSRLSLPGRCMAMISAPPCISFFFLLFTFFVVPMMAAYSCVTCA